MLKNPNFLSSFSLKLISLKAFSSDIHSGQHFYQTHLKNTSVSVFLGDLTEEKTDAIGNIDKNNNNNK